MHQFSNINKDTLLQKPNFQSYEWWYFDFIDEINQLSGVIIFYIGNLFSPNYVNAKTYNTAFDTPAVSVSIYKEGKTIFYSFFEFEKDDLGLVETNVQFNFKLPNASFLIDTKKKSASIYLNQKLPNNSTLKLECHYDLSKKPPFLSEKMKYDSQSNMHVWNLISASSEVIITALEVNDKRIDSKKAIGYHDHNAGDRPLKFDFDDWYWGRFYLSNDSYGVYYLSFNGSNIEANAWLVSDNEEYEDLVDFKLSSKKRGFNFLKSSKIIELQFDSTVITIDNRHVVDNGPFYQRYISKVYTSNHLFGIGIAEYIKPKNIHNKWVGKMVNTRLIYWNKKANWIQKSKLFYEWTWKV